MLTDKEFTKQALLRVTKGARGSTFDTNYLINDKG